MILKEFDLDFKCNTESLCVVKDIPEHQLCTKNCTVFVTCASAALTVVTNVSIISPLHGFESYNS